MKIDLARQLAEDPAFRCPKVRVYAGSALALDLIGIPRFLAGGEVTGVSIGVVNADGLAASASATRFRDAWSALIPASHFANYGAIANGFVVTISISSQSDGAQTVFALSLIRDFEVLSSSPSTQPGDPSRTYVLRGEDQYIKSYLSGTTQHYKRVVLVYDDDMAAWAFDPQGDYVLTASGTYEEVYE